MALGIQIHSVDNNAAVPWEYYPLSEADAGTKVYVGKALSLLRGEVGSGITVESELYLSAVNQDFTGEEWEHEEGPLIAVVHVRDDMVLEGYALDAAGPEIKLGDRAMIGVLSDCCYFMEGGGGVAPWPYEVVGIITDCEPALIKIDDYTIFPLTKKVLVRLVK